MDKIQDLEKLLIGKVVRTLVRGDKKISSVAVQYGCLRVEWIEIPPTIYDYSFTISKDFIEKNLIPGKLYSLKGQIFLVEIDVNPEKHFRYVNLIPI